MDLRQHNNYCVTMINDTYESFIGMHEVENTRSEHVMPCQQFNTNRVLNFVYKQKYSDQICLVCDFESDSISEANDRLY